ncbi:LysR family transcriptional regulator [Rhizobium mayense]|uniref:LysR family transcriptional regulator n=1 Tax=Rhizobium mayense TaxID=1312184 RepID=A0ABT7K494_9HYPH|nr:LysR family transcriptional regulator [Rhizobium mayense]MDL2403417.1 LysR family transcriptional regulator [Rhizobium mayense]
MDRLEAMEYFIAAVETGSFSAAGRQLNVPLPTVSRKVADLETHLNTQLLVRSTRKLALTEAGASYLAACKRILDQVEEAESQAAGDHSVPRGGLKITAPIVFGRLYVVPVVTAFLAEFPEINVYLTLSDRTLDLVDEHVDLAVRTGMLSDTTLVATKVGEIRRVVCGSPAYFSAHGTPKTLDDLAKHMCVTYTALASGSTWIFNPRDGKPSRGVRPQCRLKINTAEAAIDAAISGIGVTNVLSYQIVKPVSEGKLSLILQDFEPEPTPVNIIYARQALLPLKIRLFIDFAVSHLRKSLDDDLARLR